MSHDIVFFYIYINVFPLLKNFAMVRKYKTRISISFHTLTAIAHQRKKKLKIQLHTYPATMYLHFLHRKTISYARLVIIF